MFTRQATGLGVIMHRIDTSLYGTRPRVLSEMSWGALARHQGPTTVDDNSRTYLIIISITEIGEYISGAIPMVKTFK